ncbi:MAG: inorganic diphosphatase [Leptolinea sp.]|jgi:inorganic pyrophosphatase|nr:inorganic diphosphatase [Leptolinea sp.]
MTKNTVIEIEMSQPGRPTGQYYSTEHNQLRLLKILYPEMILPFDIGFLPNTITSQGNPLQVILLGDTSHPPHTQISARLLGGIQTDGTVPFLLAVSDSDDRFSSVFSLDDLSVTQRLEIGQYLQPTLEYDLTWLNVDVVNPLIKEALRKYRLIKVEGYQPVSKPSWKPGSSQNHITSYNETEHYTPAEYTFFQLPYHIQYYVSENLADDERILYALRRPAMRSCKHRTWLGKEKINEGVLILTTQRLIHLVEMVPLGDSGVRYGFNAKLGPLERLSDIKTDLFGDEVMLLQTTWEANEGTEVLEWETPLYTRSSLLELISILENFLPKNINPLTLRRAVISHPTELPALIDPASNNPQLEDSVIQHFTETLHEILNPNENAHSWALWPSWYENKGLPQVLIVTDNRLLIISYSETEKDCVQEFLLKNIATLEYAGSILHSHISFNIKEGGISLHIELSFPYPAEGAFHKCFEAMRRCMAVLPLIS